MHNSFVCPGRSDRVVTPLTAATIQPEAPPKSGTPRNDNGAESIVVVGNGPVGFRFVRNLVARQWNRRSRITVFGEERHPAYDRVHLTSTINQPGSDNLIYESPSWYEENGIRLHTGDRIDAIDRKQKQVHSRRGETVSYDHLVLATGSTPFVPPIAGTDLEGVFVYRTIDDLIGIRTWVRKRKRAIVVGGGLLGLEAAQALVQLGCSVVVIEAASALLARHLDTTVADILLQKVGEAGIDVQLQRRMEAIKTAGSHLQVVFADGEGVETDLVVFAAGIRPRDSLARSAGLKIGHHGGVVVDDQLRSSDPQISAIGECAEHEGTVYGLVTPGFQMANVLSDRVCGTDAAFSGAQMATRLKFAGADVMFAGEYRDAPNSVSASWRSGQEYIRLAIRRGRLVGVMAVGDVPQVGKLQDAVHQQRRIFWWHLRRFERCGRLWAESSGNIAAWPTSAVICSCAGVSKGVLSEACDRGCSSVQCLAAETGATTVCGSCEPLVLQLLGASESAPVKPISKSLLALSLAAVVLVGLLLTARPIAQQASVQTASTVWQTLLTNNIWRQVTGYSLLGTVSLSLLLSLRKRTPFLRRFEFSALRLLHVALAVSALVILLGHTGFHRGHNLNFYLFATFMTASISGAIVGVFAAAESKLAMALRSFKRPLILTHIIFLWPLPVLIAFHIVSVYWF